MGADGIEAILASLPDGERAQYRDASALSWVPQPVVREVTRRVAERLGRTGEELAEQIVHASVEELCSGPWNALLRWTSDEALITRASSLFARSFDVGRIEVRRVGEAIEVVLSGWPEAERMDLVSLKAGLHATLASAGRAARVELTRQPDGARYLVRLPR